MSRRIERRFRFAAAVDARGVLASPAVAVVAFDESSWPACRLLKLSGGGGGGAAQDRSSEVLLPAFVNAHTHLDLTHIGPRDHDPAAGFASWLRMILEERAEDAAGVTASVLAGVERALAGGVVAVGDVAGAGRTEPVAALRGSPLAGQSSVEFFGLGGRQRAAVDAMGALAASTPALEGGVRLGLSPHAPYSAGPEVFAGAARIAAEHGLGLCAHLAESADERRFVAEAGGPIREMLDGIGVLDGAALRDFGRGERSVGRLAESIRAGRWLFAHCGDVDDAELALLAGSGSSVAYCPRSSAYFGHDRELGPHRYRDMLAAGVNVCLGTDSIINLPWGERGERPTLGVLDEMRYLHDRDGADALALLAMGTVNGARALGLEEERFLLTPGEKAGLAAVRAAGGTLESALAGRGPASLVTA